LISRLISRLSWPSWPPALKGLDHNDECVD